MNADLLEPANDVFLSERHLKGAIRYVRSCQTSTKIAQWSVSHFPLPVRILLPQINVPPPPPSIEPVAVAADAQESPRSGVDRCCMLTPHPCLNDGCSTLANDMSTKARTARGAIEAP